MNLYRAVLILLATASVAFAADPGDVANERIPVSKGELEQHWQVDCSVAWARMLEIGDLGRPQEDCGLPPELVRHLQLCAFIHQPPGASHPGSCPDYRAVHEAINRGSCPMLRKLTESGGCEAPAAEKSTRGG
jgi:hypothetical protein